MVRQDSYNFYFAPLPFERILTYLYPMTITALKYVQKFHNWATVLFDLILAVVLFTLEL